MNDRVSPRISGRRMRTDSSFSDCENSSGSPHSLTTFVTVNSSASSTTASRPSTREVSVTVVSPANDFSSRFSVMAMR